jgi:hypothetical protein
LGQRAAAWRACAGAWARWGSEGQTRPSRRQHWTVGGWEKGIRVSGGRGRQHAREAVGLERGNRVLVRLGEALCVGGEGGIEGRRRLGPRETLRVGRKDDRGGHGVDSESDRMTELLSEYRTRRVRRRTRSKQQQQRRRGSLQRTASNHPCAPAAVTVTVTPTDNHTPRTSLAHLSALLLHACLRSSCPPPLVVPTAANMSRRHHQSAHTPARIHPLLVRS